MAHLLADIGGITDLDTLVAAILHDTIEDTETTPGELEDQFGRTVRKLVEEMTDDKTLDKAVRKQLQIQNAPNLSRQAKAIKLADKIANAQDVMDSPPSHWSLDRRIKYLDWTEKVVAGCPRHERCARTALRRGTQEGKSDARGGCMNPEPRERSSSLVMFAATA